MPQDQKSSINNLIIVWQGSNWSVIAPDGRVLFRHYSKHVAINFAEDELSYSSSIYKPYSLSDGLSPPPAEPSAPTEVEITSRKNEDLSRFIDQEDPIDKSLGWLGIFNHFIQTLPKRMYRTLPIQHIHAANIDELERLARRYIWRQFISAIGVLMLGAFSSLIATSVHALSASSYADTGAVWGSLLSLFIFYAPGGYLFTRFLRNERYLRLVRIAQSRRVEPGCWYQLVTYTGLISTGIFILFTVLIILQGLQIQQRNELQAQLQLTQSFRISEANRETALTSTKTPTIMFTPSKTVLPTFTLRGTKTTAPTLYMAESSGVTWLVESVTTQTKASDWTPPPNMTYLVVIGTFESTAERNVTITADQFTVIVDGREYRPHTGIMQRVKRNQNMDYIGSFSGIMIKVGESKLAFLAFEIPKKHDSLMVFFDGTSVQEIK